MILLNNMFYRGSPTNSEHNDTLTAEHAYATAIYTDWQDGLSCLLIRN